MSLLSTGTTALMAFQRALNTTANNVANLKTAGYSRQSVSLATRDSTDYSFGQVGNGVKIVDIRRDADALATSRLIDSGGELARLQQLSTLTDRVDVLFSDKSTNVAGMWSKFFDAASALASDAASSPHRQQLVDNANALTTRFQQLDHELATMAEEINARLEASTADINRMSREIADLNGKIGSDADRAAPEVLDRRDQLIASLVSITGGSAVPQDGGQLNVLTAGGHALVVGTTAATLTTTRDPYQPGRLHLAMRSKGQDLPMADNTFGGQIGGMFEFRRDVLDTTRADLGRVAVGLAESFNAVHRQGVDLKGAPGGDFFSIEAPRVGAHPRNQGDAHLSAGYGDLSALSGQVVELHFRNGTWSARDANSGDPIALSGDGSAANPFSVNGITMTASGSAHEGDRFLLQPGHGVAGSISVAVTDPAAIAAAAPGAGPNSSDNRNAHQLAAVENKHLFGGGTIRLKDSVSGLTSNVGAAARDAKEQTSAQSLLHTQAQAARDSVSGVNGDEEAANILQLQQAYQAAAQLISTADTLFQTLLGATRR